jgi:4-hydroxy-tetrahydrodipicolinate synthase
MTVSAATEARPGRDASRYRGVNASMALPMTADYAPDLQALRRYARWLADQGMIAVTVNADTGEGAHLNLRERLDVVDAVKDEIGDQVTVVSGLIATYTDQAVQLAAELKGAGADALLVFSIPAFAGQPLPPELVYRYYAAVGEVGLPLIGFNLTPTLGGVIFEPDVISRISEVAQLDAVKEASFDPLAYLRTRDALRATDPGIALLSGCDNFMYESFALGAEGALLGYAGLAGELTRHVFETVKAGDLAKAEQINRDCMQPLADVLFGAPVRNSRVRIKKRLKMLGLIDEVAIRPPLLGLSEHERQTLRAAMTQAGLL